ncbi:MAG: anti-sigma factor, partial [Cryobacterium sp.]
QPDPAVWARLHQQLGLSAEVAELHAGAAFAAPVLEAVPAAPARPAAASADQPDSVRPVIALRHRRRVWLPLAAAAVLGLVAGIGGSLVWETRSAVETVTARAQLDPLPGRTETGTATVAVDSDGRRQVVIEVEQHTGQSAADETLREVWLLNADATGLVSLGLLDGSSGRFAVPSGIDLGRYPLVDVSVEPDDGDPGHSGNSIVRGDLRTT